MANDAMLREVKNMERAIAAQSAIENSVRATVARLSGCDPEAVHIEWHGLACTGSVARHFHATERVIPGEVIHG